MICPQCQREVPEINQGRFCPFCGAVLEEPGMAAPPASAEPATTFSPVVEPSIDQGARREYVPWEDRERLGFLPAFSQTWSDATFRPAQFFRACPKTGNLGPPFLYAFLIGMVATLISYFWQYQFWDSFSSFSEMPEMEGFGRLFGAGWNRDMLRYLVLGSPFLVVISIFSRAGILHLMLIIVGGNRHGWDATLRAVCYSAGPQLFSLVPWCGDVVSFFWQLVLTVTGARELHQTPTARVALAVLLPFVLCCGSALFLAIRFAEMLSRFGTQI